MKVEKENITLKEDRTAMRNILLKYVLSAKNHIVSWKLSGNPVHRRTGTLARSVQEKRINDLEYELGSYGVEYASKLEYNPRFAKYNRWFAGGVEEALSGVNTEKEQERIIKTLGGRK